MKSNSEVMEYLRSVKSGMEKEPPRIEEMVVGGKRFKNTQPHMRLGDRVRLVEVKK